MGVSSARCNSATRSGVAAVGPPERRGHPRCRCFLFSMKRPCIGVDRHDAQLAARHSSREVRLLRRGSPGAGSTPQSLKSDRRRPFTRPPPMRWRPDGSALGPRGRDERYPLRPPATSDCKRAESGKALPGARSKTPERAPARERVEGLRRLGDLAGDHLQIRWPHCVGAARGTCQGRAEATRSIRRERHPPVRMGRPEQQAAIKQPRPVDSSGR